MATSRENLPLLALPKDAVLLPGATLRVPITNRPDLLALVLHLLHDPIRGRALPSRSSSKPAVVGCIHVRPSVKDQDPEDVMPAVGLPLDQEIKRKYSEFGTAATIVGLDGRFLEGLVLVLQGVSRFRVLDVTQTKPFVEGVVAFHDGDERQLLDHRACALFEEVKILSRNLLLLSRLPVLAPSNFSRIESPGVARRLELLLAGKEAPGAGSLADFVAEVFNASPDEKLQVLAAWDVKDRLKKAKQLLLRLNKTFREGSDAPLPLPISPLTDTNIPTLDRPSSAIILRRNLTLPPGPMPLGFPPPGLGSLGNIRKPGDEEGGDIANIKKKLEAAKLSPEAQTVAQKELKRLQRMNPNHQEYQICLNYLELVADLPWILTTQDGLDGSALARARAQLDADHYGLDKVKKRLLEYLAVLRLKQNTRKESEAKDHGESREETGGDGGLKEAQPGEDSQNTGRSIEIKVGLVSAPRLVDRSPILLLVGPPGTGKTALSRSIATALGRKFHRISLGGVRDEAEIRGHRRTYVAAMPGLIVNGLRKVGVANPVFLLDEIDKVGMANFQGDPAAAMLEVLDPEQNHTFKDHYLGIPLDLSKVLFIATANTVDTIAAPLLDRMETITLSGYTTLEKREISLRHLVPKQILANGLKAEHVRFGDDVVDKIITVYTRESGVRNLEREIGAVCRAKAVAYAEAKDTGHLETYRPDVTMADLEDALGVEKFEDEIAERSGRAGVVTGLVAYRSGGQGSILFIEAADMPGKGRVQLTGKLGDVLKESVEVALSWVKAHAFELGLTAGPTEDVMKNRNVHVHCPAGAIPKDGPSAGLAHTIALISLFSGKVVPATTAMTGEMSLRGRITAVGGIKEKLIGASRAGVKLVLIPATNRKDLKDLPEEVRQGLEIVCVRHIWEALRHVWPDSPWPGEEELALLDTRL